MRHLALQVARTFPRSSTRIAPIRSFSDHPSSSPAHLKPVNFAAWIDSIKHTLQPPVANKLLYGDGQLKVMVVGGPNQREDHHLEYGEEIFFQLQGTMNVDILERNAKKRIEIPEGNLFLLPRRVPHSPQRYANTVGLVIERQRRKEEIDGLMWFTPGTTKTLYEEYFYCTDLGTELKPVIERYFASEAYKTKDSAKAFLHPNPPIVPDPHVTTAAPLNLQNTQNELMSSSPSGCSCIYRSEFKVSFVWGETAVDITVTPNSEVFLWQQQGSSAIKVKNNPMHTTLEKGFVHLLTPEYTTDGVITVRSGHGGATIVVSNTVLPN